MIAHGVGGTLCCEAAGDGRVLHKGVYSFAERFGSLPTSPDKLPPAAIVDGNRTLVEPSIPDNQCSHCCS